MEVLLLQLMWTDVGAAVMLTAQHDPQVHVCSQNGVRLLSCYCNGLPLLIPPSSCHQRVLPSLHVPSDDRCLQR